MTRAEILTFWLLMTVALLGTAILHRQELSAAEKMAADCRATKEPKKLTGERLMRAGYPGLPAHLRCPRLNGRGAPLKDWHAVQADGGNWEVACRYEGAK